jgi:uncharacterized protein YukE
VNASKEWIVTIRVNPDSIRTYANQAQQQFETVHGELVALVNDAVNVHYFGPNAADFKNHCGEMASDFGRKLSQDLGKIADAVRTSTTAIATSLGGVPISISVNGATIPIPQVSAGDGSVEVEVSALEQLKPVVNGHITAIAAQMDAHLTNLQNTDWTGQAKDSAVDAVRGFTTSAKSLVTETGQSINSYIDKQISMVVKSDR